jgi:N-acetylmuramoyl-L-alanine amidase
MKETKDTRTPAQKEALLRLLKELRAEYPAAKIYGHCDFANKACPCFDAKKEYANI